MNTHKNFGSTSSMIERIMSCTYFDGVTDSEVCDNYRYNLFFAIDAT